MVIITMIKWSYEVVATTMLVQVSRGNCWQDSDILCIVLSGCNSSRDGDYGGDMLMGWWRNGGGAVVMIVVEKRKERALQQGGIYSRARLLIGQI